MTTSGDVVGTVADINRYPVKSMQGEALDEVMVTADGIDGDRTWALRDPETGKLVSAKRPSLWSAALECRATGTGDDVEVTLPGGETRAIHDPSLRVALSALFGRDIAIEASTGPQQGIYESDWPEIDGLTLSGSIDFPTNLTGNGSTFVDLDPLHLLTTTSMATLAALAPGVTIDPVRFRPSILFDTPDLEGFPENDWSGRTLVIGEGADAPEILLGDPSPRCIMTTLAQPGLPRQGGVLKAIAAHNRLTNPLGTFACLGCYATIARPGRIRTGDLVRISGS